jgi:hypothetical protein
MDFDHVRGEKFFNVSRGPQFGKRWLLAEAGKCEIVCAYMRAHYEANRDYYLAKALRSNSKRRTDVRAMLHELKSVPCAACGTAYPPWVMEFDHVRGQKLFNVSEGLERGAKDLLAEAAKCEIVCSNCHQDRTWQRQHMRP